MWTHPSKVEGNENTRTQVDTTQRENKGKQSTKFKEKPYAKMTHGNKMTINNNKENIRRKNCHLPQIG
jgi:hypothetical protein